jgi:radical SAM protein with 4Fe4S-binding SPASM domain
LNDNYNDSVGKIKEILLVGSSKKRWICEVHREIYDIVDEEIYNEEKKDKILNLIAEAYWLGKKMSDKLKSLKINLSEEHIGDNLDFNSDIHRRAIRLRLLKDIKYVFIEDMPTNINNRLLRQLMDYGYNGNITKEIYKNDDKSCGYFLNKLYFNSKGDMIVCRNSDIIFGNITNKPLSLILTSDLYYKYYHAHKEGKQKEVCERCNCIL